MKHPRKDGASASHKQRGAAALVLAALMVIFSGSLIGAYFYVDSRTDAATASYEQIDSLQWSQEAVNGFASAYGRLPCPSKERGGTEDCGGSNVKGWLPTASIEHFVRPSGARGRLHARYVVYRGAGGTDPDLAVADDAYQPALVDGSPAPKYPKVISSIDLCGKLRTIIPASDAKYRWQLGDSLMGGPARSDRAGVRIVGGGGSGGSGGVMNIAYGVSVAPTGTADKGSGINADGSAQLESPQRAIDGTYKDIVRVVDFGSLYQAMSCPITMASLDTLAVARTWVDESVGMREGAINGSNKLVDIETVIISSEMIEVASASIDVRNALSSKAKAVALVNLATPGLPATITEFTRGITGIAKAIATINYAVKDATRSTIGLGTESAYMLVYRDLAKKAEASRVWADATGILETADRLGTTP